MEGWGTERHGSLTLVVDNPETDHEPVEDEVEKQERS